MELKNPPYKIFAKHSNGFEGVEIPLFALGNITKCPLKKFRGDYFLIKVFDNLEKKKKLNMIKYNKNMKKKIDYKKYSEKYTPIEIEIRPVNNKYGQFINYRIGIVDLYHHIYFNNNKEEIKRNYIYEGEQINKIKIIIDYQIKSFENLFYNCDCIESIKFKKFYRKNINNMSCMFSGC